MRNDNQRENEDQSQTTLPKGVGLSPRMFFMAGVITSVVLIGVMLMIFHYRGAKKDDTPADQGLLVKQQTTLTSDDEIRELNQNQKNGALIMEKKSSSTAPVAISNQQSWDESSQNSNRSPDHDLSSPISVLNNFQGISGNSNTNASATTAPLTINTPPTTTSMDKTNDSYQTQNGQDQKTAFLQANQSSTSNFYLSSQLTKPVSPYEVKAGTIISALLLTGINSDLPGEIIGQVSQNVYDTVTGNYLLIPQGTRVIGVYDSKVAYGQSRVLIAWSRLIYPNGDSFDLQGQPGADLMGMAGLQDQVNNHYVRIFGSALAFSLFGALGQLSQPQQSQNAYPSNAQIIYGAIGQNMTQAGIQLTEKNMNIQPTITIRPGANFNILLTRDMVLPGAYQYVF